ncbi:hypothetical protein CHUAL_012314 [Chamberlinius hualienensis]
MDLRGYIDAYMWTWTIVDHRTDGWLFMHSIKPVLLILTIFYILSAIGPKVMKNRPPLNCLPLALSYCCVVVCINIYLVYNGLVGALRMKYNWICEAVNSSRYDENEMRMVKGCHLFMISKMIEMLDLVFVILYKIKHQPNLFLIFHHSSMFFMSWIVVRWSPSGSAVVFWLINGIAHTFTYIYLGCFAIGPEFRKNAFVRLLRLLTGIIQSIQYLILVCFSLNGILTGCDYTNFVFYMVVVFILLSGFVTLLDFHRRKLLNIL